MMSSSDTSKIPNEGFKSFKLSLNKTTTKLDIKTQSQRENSEQTINQFESNQPKYSPSVSTLIAISNNEIEEIDTKPHEHTKLIIPCDNPLPVPKTLFTQDKPIYLSPESEIEGSASPPKVTSSKNSTKHQTDAKEINEEDQIAAEMLLKEARGEKVTQGVVPILAQNAKFAELRRSGLPEHLILKKELDTLPEMKYDGYDRVPIEDFGIAMLLGMGYDPKKHISQPLELKKRIYERAGLGAEKAIEVDMEAARKSLKEEQLQISENTNSRASKSTKLDEKSHNLKTSPQQLLISNKNYDSKLEDDLPHDKESKANNTILTSSSPKGSEAHDQFGHWTRKGLYVKIASPKSHKYKRKGIIIDIKVKNGKIICQLDLSHSPPSYSSNDPYFPKPPAINPASGSSTLEYAEDLESTVSRRTVYAKCVGKKYSAYGEVVKVVDFDQEQDYIEFQKVDSKGHSYGKRYSGGLDDVCEFADLS